MILMLAAALATAAPLSFTVTDSDATPIERAFVQIDIEGERHSVLSGGLELSVLYLADGTVLVPGKGSSLRYTAGAPGYVPTDGLCELDKHRVKVAITLEPMDLTAEAPGGAVALEAARAWAALDPGDAAAIGAAEATLREAVQAWIATGTFDARALQLCRMVALSSDECDAE